MQTRVNSSNIHKSFESTEHQILGQIKLPGLTAKSANEALFSMPNNTQISFGDIIALVDYYAVPKKPISQGLTVKERKDELSIKERKERFINAYNTLAHARSKEVNNLLKMFQKQRQLIERFMLAGKPEYEAIKKFALEELIKGLIYTRFKSYAVTQMNFDHFGENAIEAHRAGHLVAQETAARAYATRDSTLKQALLEEAYAQEAFACHFITDRCASGHMRTPRVALQDKFGPTIGGFLALFMHGEENAVGLNVINKKGDKWEAYGDARLLERYNQRTKEITIALLQTVILEVYQAYETGIVRTQDSAAYDYLPIPTGNNIQQMFLYDPVHDDILVRCEIDNISCKKYESLTWDKIPCLLMHFGSHYVTGNMNNGAQPHVSSQSLFKHTHEQGTDLRRPGTFAPKFN